MKSIAGVSLFMVMLITGCSKSVYISGDSQSVGAEIFIDGQRVGTMKRVVVGPSSKDFVVAEREKEIMESMGIKVGTVIASGFIEVPSGEHEVTFVSVEGKRLTKHFKIRGDRGLNVSFEKMSIEDE